MKRTWSCSCCVKSPAIITPSWRTRSRPLSNNASQCTSMPNALRLSLTLSPRARTISQWQSAWKRYRYSLKEKDSKAWVRNKSEWWQNWSSIATQVWGKAHYQCLTRSTAIAQSKRTYGNWLARSIQKWKLISNWDSKNLPIRKELQNPRKRRAKWSSYEQVIY